MTTRIRTSVAAIVTFGFCLTAWNAEAIPAWARKYHTSCATCHVAFPKLNSFGKAFRANGYRMPGGDEDLTKIKDVPLGSEAWKRLWPKGIWPGAIPGIFPFAVLVDNQLNVEEGREIKTDLAFPQSIQLLGGGTLGEGFGYYVGVNLLEGNEFGGLHRVFGQFDGIKGSTMANTRFGFMEPRVVPFSGHRKLTLTNYFVNTVGFDLNTAQGVMEHGEPAEHGDVDEHGAMAPMEEHEEGLRTLDIGGGHGGHGGGGGPFTLGASQRGIEWWGAHGAGGGGGLEYAFGIVNGNAAGNNEGTFDNNGFKDFYWRASWKFGGMGVTGSMGDDEAEPVQTEGWRDDSLTVGTFGYYGRAPYELSRLVPVFDEHGEMDEHVEMGEHGEMPGAPDEHAEGPPVVDVREDLVQGDEGFKRIGADFNWLIGDLNLYGAFMYGKNDRLGFDDVTEEVDFKTWFIQGDYVFLPWVIGALRYEKADLPSNFLDVERFVPHVTLLIRANIKFVAEGQLYRKDSGRNRGFFNLTFAF